jgi:transposase
VAYNFLPVERDQGLLMPPSLAEWLPEGHLVWFLLDVVEELDLGQVYVAYRDDGWGRAAHDPRMMVALLLYAYCLGERSSRRIERRCQEDVAFRVITANSFPDHTTIARFRRRHEQALAALLVDSLALCARAGLGQVAAVAVDGTVMAANASPGKTVDRAGLQRRIDTMLAEAEQTDQAEDELYGDERGDELPPELRRKADRLERLRELKVQLEAEDARRLAAEHAICDRYEARVEAGKPTGRKPKPPGTRKKSRRALINTTDPDSRLFTRPGQGWTQGYNAQAVVSQDQIVLAAEAVADNDRGQLRPMLEQAAANLQAAGLPAELGVALADAGYWSEANARLDLCAEVLIATGAHRKLNQLPAPSQTPSVDPPARLHDGPADLDAAMRAEGARRSAIIRRWVAGEIGVQDASRELGIPNLSRCHQLRRMFLAGGDDALVPKSTMFLKRGRRPDIRAWMNAKLGSLRGRELYALRSQIAEPVFGQTKEARNIRRFRRRGRQACDGEWKFIAATHNLLKLWRVELRITPPRLV